MKGIIIKIFVIGFFLAGNGLEVYAQSQIHGAICDGKEKPVSKANVMLMNAFDSSELVTTIANEEGIYVFTNLAFGDYTIKVTAIGFEQKYSPLYSIVSAQDEVNTGVLVLQIKGQQLNGVVVTAKKPLCEQKIDRTIINVKSSITQDTLLNNIIRKWNPVRGMFLITFFERPQNLF